MTAVDGNLEMKKKAHVNLFLFFFAFFLNFTKNIFSAKNVFVYLCVFCCKKKKKKERRKANKKLFLFYSFSNNISFELTGDLVEKHNDGKQ